MKIIDGALNSVSFFQIIFLFLFIFKFHFFFWIHVLSILIFLDSFLMLKLNFMYHKECLINQNHENL